MGSTLSERQKEELHKSMLDYLHSAGFKGAYDALRADAGLAGFDPDADAGKAKWRGLLEKKWTSVIRLQKKVMDLESRNTQLAQELTDAPSTSRKQSDTTWIPRAPSRHTLKSHRSPITRVTFHPLYISLASASEDATVKIWDWESGEFERTVKGHTKAVCDVDYDSKGTMLVSCSSDLTVKLWDVANEYKNTKTLYGHDHSVSTARFMPSDDFVVSASRDKTIKVWEVSSGFCVKTFSGHADWVRSVIPSSDGRLLVSCSSDHTARIWDASTGETKMDLRDHDHVVEVAVFAPAASGPAIRELGGLGPPPAGGDRGRASTAFAATGSRDKTIKIWDVTSGQCVRTLVGHDNWIRALVFHPSGLYLLSASDDKTIRVWDLKTGRCIKTLNEAHTHFVTCMAWGRTKAAGGATTNGTNGATVEERPVNVIATGSVDQSVKVWLP